jgi:hypothetical protein
MAAHHQFFRSQLEEINAIEFEKIEHVIPSEARNLLSACVAMRHLGLPNPSDLLHGV